MMTDDLHDECAKGGEETESARQRQNGCSDGNCNRGDWCQMNKEASFTRKGKTQGSTEAYYIFCFMS